MNAPWEVWVGTQVKIWQPEPLAIGYSVRYLRADLTCGECEFASSDGYDPICVNNKSQFYKDMLESDGAACMAFAPREER